MLEIIKEGNRRAVKTLFHVARIGLLPTILLAAMAVALFFGPVSIAPGDVIHVLLHKLGVSHFGTATSPLIDSIIWNIRLPRIVAAALVGAALAIAGTLFQAILRNPLADPYIIGTSAGAQVGVALALILPFQFSFLGFGTVQLLSFTGAVATVLFVYAIARTGSGTSIVTLLLAGFVVSSFLISATSLLATAEDRLRDLLIWTLGGIAVSEWRQLRVAVPCIVIAGIASYMLAPQLDVILLGEEEADSLGIRVETLKIAGIIFASFLTAFAVTLAGVVAFVGLIVPHAVRLVYGPSHRLLLPSAALCGAAFVVLADLIARTALAPREIPLGVMTAMLGAPVFLSLLRSSRKSYGN